jgi:hypothetical protein
MVLFLFSLGKIFEGEKKERKICIFLGMAD